MAVNSSSMGGYSKKLIILGLLLVLAIALWAYQMKTGVASSEFVGTIKERDGNMLTVEGVWVVPGRPELSEPADKTSVKVDISKTKITKVNIQIPSRAALEASGGTFNADELPRTSVEGSVNDLGVGQSITLKSRSNMYGKATIKPNEISYNNPVFPE
jgi:hypothetical protein